MNHEDTSRWSTCIKSCLESIRILRALSAGSFCTCHANLWPQHDGELSSPQEDMEGLQPILLETEMYELQQDMETWETGEGGWVDQIVQEAITAGPPLQIAPEDKAAMSVDEWWHHLKCVCLDLVLRCPLLFSLGQVWQTVAAGPMHALCLFFFDFLMQRVGRDIGTIRQATHGITWTDIDRHRQTGKSASAMSGIWEIDGNCFLWFLVLICCH